MTQFLTQTSAASLLQRRCLYRLQFLARVLELGIAMRRPSIPIAAILSVTLHLVQHGVDPAGERIVVLHHDVVSRVPIAREGGGDSVAIILAHVG